MSGLFGYSKKNNNNLFSSNESEPLFSSNLKNNNQQNTLFSNNSNFLNLNNNEKSVFFTSPSINNENKREEINNEDENLLEKEEEEEENEEKTIKIIHINEYFIYIKEKILTKSKKFQKLKKNIQIDFDINKENLQILTLDEKNIFHELKDENEYIKLYDNINELYFKYEKIGDLIEEQNNYDFVLQSD